MGEDGLEDLFLKKAFPHLLEAMNYYTNGDGEMIFNTARPDNFFEVNLCGYTPPNPKYNIYRFQSALCVLEYVISGVGYIDSDDGKLTVRAGDFYLLRSGFTGHYYPDPDEPFSKIWVNIRGSLVERLCDIYGFHAPVTAVHSADRRIYDDLRAILDTFSAHEDDDLTEPFRQSSIRVTDILSLARHPGTESLEVCSDALRIHDYLDLHICDDLTLPMIADAMYMHEATVIRVFKEKYGTTPMKCLNSMRVEAAKRMLIEHIPVKRIAEMLKFSDPSYFSLCFRRETGMTPAQFAAQNPQVT